MDTGQTTLLRIAAFLVDALRISIILVLPASMVSYGMAWIGGSVKGIQMVWWVALAHHPSDQPIESAMSQALQIPLTEPSALTAWITAIRGREMLLVLDGMEQLVDQAAILSELLHAAPDLRLVVTSRAALGGFW